MCCKYSALGLLAGALLLTTLEQSAALDRGLAELSRTPCRAADQDVVLWAMFFTQLILLNCRSCSSSEPPPLPTVGSLIDRGYTIAATRLRRHDCGDTTAAKRLCRHDCSYTTVVTYMIAATRLSRNSCSYTTVATCHCGFLTVAHVITQVSCFLGISITVKIICRVKVLGRKCTRRDSPLRHWSCKKEARVGCPSRSFAFQRAAIAPRCRCLSIPYCPSRHNDCA